MRGKHGGLDGSYKGAMCNAQGKVGVGRHVWKGPGGVHARARGDTHAGAEGCVYAGAQGGGYGGVRDDLQGEGMAGWSARSRGEGDHF